MSMFFYTELLFNMFNIANSKMEFLKCFFDNAIQTFS